MPLWMAPHFAAELGVSEVEVLRRAGLDVPQSISAPLISWVAASQFAEIAEPVSVAAEYPRVTVDYHRDTLFVLEVVGDSMDKIAPEGSLIAVDYAYKDLRDKDLAIFSSSGATTFKRFRADESGAWLEPESFNRRHSVIVPEGEDAVEIIGRVVAIPRIARTDISRTKLLKR